MATSGVVARFARSTLWDLLRKHKGPELYRGTRTRGKVQLAMAGSFFNTQLVRATIRRLELKTLSHCLRSRADRFGSTRKCQA